MLHDAVKLLEKSALGNRAVNWPRVVTDLTWIIVQGGSNMTGTDLCEATTSTLPPARVRTCSVLSGSCYSDEQLWLQKKKISPSHIWTTLYVQYTGPHRDTGCETRQLYHEDGYGIITFRWSIKKNSAWECVVDKTGSGSCSGANFGTRFVESCYQRNS